MDGAPPLDFRCNKTNYFAFHKIAVGLLHKMTYFVVGHKVIWYYMTSSCLPSKILHLGFHFFLKILNPLALPSLVRARFSALLKT